MSRRPSITSYPSRTDGKRRLAPMRNSHPKLHKLRRCTSLEWIYNSNDDSDDENDDQRAVQRQDGSLPVMSYWYGKLSEIYLKSGTHVQDVWLEIQWYYRQVDLKDEDVDLAACVGEYELVLSNHTSVVDMSCVEDHANIFPYDEGDISQRQIPVVFKAAESTLRPRQIVHAIDAIPHFPPQSQSNDTAGNVLTGSMKNVLQLWGIPCVAIRGGSCGVVGNAVILIQGKALMEAARTIGRLPEGWKDNIQQAMLPIGDDTIPRYYCQSCMKEITPMHPSCDLSEWNAHDVQQLLKMKGTIQDVDGECSLKVIGHSRKGCLIAPHYRLPLYALNKKIGIYRKVIEHLQKSSSTNATTLRDTYASVMKYLNDVRTAFVDDAAASSDPTNKDFRSSTVDYYLWLDHTCDGFHDVWRQSLATEHGVTIEGVENGECSDILVFRSGGEENMESLLNVIDACVNASIDQESTAPSISVPQINMVSDSTDVNPSTFPTFPLPFDMNFRRLALSTLGSDAHKIIVGGFGKWLPSHVAMRFREIQGLDHNDPLDNLVANGLLLTAKHLEEYLEIFGMAEMMATCQELSADRGAMSRFFTAAGRAIYISRTGKECVVEYGQTVPSTNELIIAMDSRACTAVAVGVQCDFIAECKVQLPPSRVMMDREMQTDIIIDDKLNMDASNHGINEPAFQPDLLQPEEYLHDKCHHYDREPPSFDPHDDNSGDLPQSTSIHLEASVTSNPDISDTSSYEYDLSKIRDTLKMSTPLKSRLCQDTQVVSQNVPATTVERHGSKKSERPVIFAKKRPVVANNAFGVSKSVKQPRYTIQDLVREAQEGTSNVTPFLSSFIMDPEGIKFLISTIDSNYDSWLFITRHIAFLLRKECMTRSMRKMAVLLMSFDIWIKDVSDECNKALQSDTEDKILPPLHQQAHCVILELSARAILDEQSIMVKAVILFMKGAIQDSANMNIGPTNLKLDIRRTKSMPLSSKVIAIEPRQQLEMI
ncbi:uncharacterized protein HD556DRAFT_1311176 [Suillus plorans]|uniref:Uncharacterized protein n=1 Tax=Suillus plorans TaxID=116603 RepID=A0A9P7AJA9_9AGAM|nr:uncharacterized protein HD556DRAFT_1311176 [Suillus plorans]KAG1789582.1 hypothetical protein HD556DRAFT_1311176 [Suillus plorans]